MVVKVRDKCRVIYSLCFTTLSELHIGSGTERDGVAGVVVGSGEKAWIPGATLKGALRTLAQDAYLRLFGKPHEENSANSGDPERFAQGELTVFGLAATSAEPRIAKTRTAVDPGTGASAAQKLFTQEYVEVGTEFVGDIVLECGSHRLQKARGEFEHVLSCFAATDGVPVGAGKADGLGRIRLTSATVQVATLAPNGWQVRASNQALELAPADEDGWTGLDMECPGPYLVMGSQEPEGPEGFEVTKPERRGDLPRLFSAGVSGALRSRAGWLVSIAALRGAAGLEASRIVVTTSSGNAERNVIQRLFGDEGYRGSLQIRVTDVQRKGTSRHPAGPLDPLVQAPLEGALHRREADHGVSFKLSLRMWRTDAPQDERDLLASLESDLRRNGLALGLGTTKGFGWFGMDATPTSAQDSSPHALPDVSNLESQLPHAAITLPYRLAEVDLHKVGMPHPEVASAARARRLHDQPLADGICGWLDVSWCFDTPMLIGDGGAVRTPQKVGDKYVIPGTTLRGSLRSILEIVTQSRLGASRHNRYATGDRRKTFPLEQPLRRLDQSTLHNPRFDADFQPDFVQALLGFVAPTSDRYTPEEHAALHLKSRVSFGWAWLKHGRSAAKGVSPQELLLPPPNATSAFHDHVGRRIYPTTSLDADQIEARLAAARGGNAEMRSKVRFLYPIEDECLVFRGRIRFHNLHPVELGAVLWAITFGWRPYGRHMIGQARPLGAGRGFATDLQLNLIHNDGRTTPPDITPAWQGKAEDAFGMRGASAKPYVALFDDWLAASGLKTHGFFERVAAANPAIGDSLRKKSRLSPGTLGYQTAQTLDQQLDDDRDRTKRRAIATFNAGTSGGERLAAMLRNLKKK